MSAPEPAGEIQQMLDPRCVSAQVVCADVETLLRLAAALLVNVGAVEKEYADEIVAREREYPTGLPTQPFGVALPHADRGIRRSAIALMTVRDPVLFREMGSDDREVSVRLVILLALPGGEKHVQAMAVLAEVIQQPGALQEMIQANTAADLYQAFVKWAEKGKPSPQ